MLSRLSDFMTGSAYFNIQIEGSISQPWNTVRRQNVVYMFTRHSYIQILNNDTIVILLQVGKDFIIRVGASVSQLQNTVGR